jgi:hypothetical protein
MQRVPCQSHGNAKGECWVTSSGLFPVSIQDTETSHHDGNDDGTQCCHENANGLHNHLYHIYLKTHIKQFTLYISLSTGPYKE